MDDVLCMWCDNHDVLKTTKNCYWILPDGTDAVEITSIPAISCPNCGSYLSDEMNHEIDLALYAKELPANKQIFSYEELLKAPYKNIFDLKK